MALTEAKPSATSDHFLGGICPFAGDPGAGDKAGPPRADAENHPVRQAQVASSLSAFTVIPFVFLTVHGLAAGQAPDEPDR